MPFGAHQANGEQVAWREKRKHVQPRINWQQPHSTPLFLRCTFDLYPLSYLGFYLKCA
jgi:hypothetical protein